MKGGREEFRARIMDRLLPALRAYAPDLILISAGFDGGERDMGCRRLSSENSGQCAHGLDLLPEDYQWVTDGIAAVGRMSDAKIISVLEGGYGQETREEKTSYVALANNTLAHISGLVGRK